MVTATLWRTGRWHQARVEPAEWLEQGGHNVAKGDRIRLPKGPLADAELLQDEGSEKEPCAKRDDLDDLDDLGDAIAQDAEKHVPADWPALVCIGQPTTSVPLRLSGGGCVLGPRSVETCWSRGSLRKYGGQYWSGV